MADKQAETASKVHKAILKYMRDKQPSTIPARTFQSLYITDDSLWSSFQKAVDDFDSKTDLVEKIVAAKEISKTAIDLRRQNATLNNYILSAHPDDVIDISQLRSNTITTLGGIYVRMKTKMANNTPTQATGNPEEKWNNFCSDIEVYKSIGIIHDKWFKNKNIAKMKQYAKQKGHKFPNFEIPSESKDNQIFVETYNNILSEMQKELDNTGSIAYANSFMVDYCIVALAHFRKHKVNFNVLENCLEKISKYTLLSAIGQDQFKRFIRTLPAEMTQALQDIDFQNNNMYFNPGRLTYQRLVGFVSCFHKVCNKHGVLTTRITQETWNLIVELYGIEGNVDMNKNVSTNYEYIIHQILTMGLKTSMLYNKTQIPRGAFEVRFAGVHGVVDESDEDNNEFEADAVD